MAYLEVRKGASEEEVVVVVVVDVVSGALEMGVYFRGCCDDRADFVGGSTAVGLL